MLVFGAGDPGSVLHAKLMATHSSMIDTPCCKRALYGALTKWTPVGMLDTVRDRSPDCGRCAPEIDGHTQLYDRYALLHVGSLWCRHKMDTGGCA